MPGSTVIEWLTDREEAFAKARRERKPILIDVYQDDCEGCVKLDDETFVDDTVAAEIVDRFIPLKLGLFQDREFTRQHQVFWTPTILIADHSGRVRYTSVNYLPPAEFLDVLDIGEGLAAMRWKRFDESIALLRSVQDRRPEGPMTAEAIYWRGMAEYFRTGKASGSAKGVWAEIRERFPDSIWAKRQP
jgi:hypothetical protein